MNEQSDRLPRIRALIEAEPASSVDGAIQGRLTRLCVALDRAIPASGAGMTMAVKGAPTLVLAASGPHAEELEELQITLGQGPCVDAITSRRPVLEPDLAGSGARAWPAYCAEAGALGVAAVFSFPLQIGGVCLGGLDVYRVTPGSLTRTELADALAFTQVAFDILLDGEDRRTDGEDHRADGQGPEEMADSSVLWQAQGMIMIQLGVSLAEAMSRIRAHAFASEMRLGSVAGDILSGILTLTNDDP